MNMATATVLGALLGAAGTFAAGYMNYLKPSEKQVDSSEQYRRLADENAFKLVEIERLRQTVASLKLEGQRLSELAAKHSSEFQEAQKNLEAARDQQKSAQPEKASITLQNSGVTESLSSIPPAASPLKKNELTLVAGDAMRIRDDLTITLEYVKRYGAFLLINGRKEGYNTVGSRIQLPVLSQEKCYLEIISHTAEQVVPGKVRADMVCVPKGT